MLLMHEWITVTLTHSTPPSPTLPPPITPPALDPSPTAGAAGMLLMHEWMIALLPDVPPRIEEEAAEMRYAFKNVFTGAISVCEFRKNEVRA